MLRWLVVGTLLPMGCSSTPTHTQIVDAVQPILDQAVAKFNMSFSFGYATGTAPYKVVVGLGVGLDDRCVKGGSECTKTHINAHSIIPAGSVTKAYTGVAILQEVEMGSIKLDSLLHLLVDPSLQRQNATTLLELWGGNKQVRDWWLA
jgi:CubicO group peptidase (beta-lactamase class C family)